MEVILPFFEVITPWHWLGLALLVLGVEMMLGTFDLLWISAAAFLTSAWAALPLPAGLSTWQAECVFFGITGVVLVVLGRTVFSGFREAISDRPHLNKRSSSMVGKSALAISDFKAGKGRVKVGDSSWMAETDMEITEGSIVTILSVDGTLLKVGV